MSKAHRNSILSTINSPIACDVNTTFTLTPISAEMYSDKGQAPTTNITTFRKGEGKFIDAFAVEESTTNLCTAPDFSSGWWKSAALTSMDVVDVPFIDGSNVKAMRALYSGTGDGHFGWNFSFTGAANKAFSISFWVRSDTTASIYGNAGVQDTTAWTWPANAGTFQVTPQWKLIKVSGIAASTCGDALRIIFRPVNNSTDYIYYTKPQVEQKGISTSFVSGTRATGALKYNINMTAPWTISFWVKPQVPNNYATTVNWVITDSPYSGAFIMWKRTSEDYYRIRIGASDCVFANTDIVQDVWSHIAIAIDTTNTKIYLNGNLTTTLSTTVNVPAISLGVSASDNAAGNNMFCNIKVDNQLKNAEEIMQMYLSNSNVYAPQDYSAVC